MWQNILIIMIVAACAFFIARRFYRQFTGRQTGCVCSCKVCDTTSTPTVQCQGKETVTGFPGKDAAEPPNIAEHTINSRP